MTVYILRIVGMLYLFVVLVYSAISSSYYTCVYLYDYNSADMQLTDDAIGVSNISRQITSSNWTAVTDCCYTIEYFAITDND